MREQPFYKVVDRCPVCLSSKSEFLFVENYLNKGERYTLFYCQLCQNQFWSPFKGPGPVWYENCAQHAERIKNDNEFLSRGNKWNVIQFLNRLPHAELNGKKLLDLGCGTGKFLIEAQKLGYDVYGVEFDGNQIQAAKNFGLKNVYHQDLFDFIKDKKETYDVITSFEVIEHLEFPKLFLDYIHKALRPGGFLCLSTPNRSRSIKKNTVSDLPPNHLTRWTRLSLKNFISAANFEKVNVIEEPLTDYVVSKFRFGLASRVRKFLYKDQNKRPSHGSYKNDKVAALGSAKDNVIRPLAYIVARCLFALNVKGQTLYLEAKKLK